MDQGDLNQPLVSIIGFAALGCDTYRNCCCRPGFKVFSTLIHSMNLPLLKIARTGEMRLARCDCACGSLSERDLYLGSLTRSARNWSSNAKVPTVLGDFNSRIYRV